MADIAPRIDGVLEISNECGRIVISGDPSALKQLAELMICLAQVEQDDLESLPTGERTHVHLFPSMQLTEFSSEVEVSRLDAKGSGLCHANRKPIASLTPMRVKSLQETVLGDVEQPQTAQITYGVCALDRNSCGWGGWILEAAFRSPKDGEEQEGYACLLPGDYDQRCPVCGRSVFRTAATVRMVRSGKGN